MKGINVIRTFIIPDTKSSSLRRLTNYFSFMFSSIIGGLSFKKYDIVYATSPHLFIGVSGYILSRLYRAKFVFEVRDLWVDFAEGLGQFNNKFFLNLARKLERFFYKKADLIITVTNGFKDLLMDQGIPEEKIEVITNGTDVEFYKPGNDKKNLRERYGLQQKFVILYAGNIGVAQGLDVVIDAADRLRNNKDIVFMLVGEGVEKERLKQKIDRYRLSNIIIEDGQTRQNIINYYNMADATLVCLKKYELFSITLPSKIFDALAVGKPILIGVDGEAREIVEGTKSGIYFEPGSGASLKDAILKLYNDRNICDIMGRNARNCAEKFYNRFKLTIKLNELLMRLL